MLGGTKALLLGLHFVVPTQTFEPRAEDVHADVCNAVLGAISGLIRALCPRPLLVRQPLVDFTALHWLRAALPEDVWQRATVRYWRGDTPELDLFGYHGQEPTGVLHLDGKCAVWVDHPSQPSPPQAVKPAPPDRSERTAILFRLDGEDHSETEERLMLWRQQVGERTVAIPAPLVHPDVPERHGNSMDCHMHAPEGAVVLWHLWRTTPFEQWPPAWVEAVGGARPHVPAWPPGLPDADEFNQV
jgi:hypothetical protein